MTATGLGWIGIVRLGLVQTALGAIVVLTTSTINRLMVVELALAAMVPGLLVAWHYALQFLRPRWGYGSDRGGRRTPWIVGGMAVLAAGGIGAALSVGVMEANMTAGLAVAILAFTLIGIGVGAAGTSLLVLLAELVAEKRRPAAATIVWIMMIGGFILTAGVAGQVLDPYSSLRLLAVASAICLSATLVTAAAVWGVEPAVPRARGQEERKASFTQTLAAVSAEPVARRFAIFIFVSMLAYSAQDLILEPFAGQVYGLTPGQTTSLSGLQNGGVLLGMILVGAAGSFLHRNHRMALRLWTAGGCLASSLALAGLFAAALAAPDWPLRLCVFALGFSNGVFAVAAIGSMFSMATSGRGHDGVRMGMFGAAQAIAFGLGGFAGTFLYDIARLVTGSPASAYAAVFAVEAGLFIAAAWLAFRLGGRGVVMPAGNPLVLAARQQAGAGGG